MSDACECRASCTCAPKVQHHEAFCERHCEEQCTCSCHHKTARECCPPPIPEQPGVVEIPQQPPPPPLRTAPTPVWQHDRPDDGDPGTIDWFRQKIATIRTKGPTLGPRKDEYLPYLVVRASSSDRGNRPLSGVFWESPDIAVLSKVDAASAPIEPPSLGGVAVAGVPNTLYAHVWNLGNAPSYRARVEFYWFNPSLGISRADAHLIGAAYVDLGNRYTHYADWQRVDTDYGAYLSRGAHAIVRCPESWIPTYENNGHECLVVRVFDPIMDPVPRDQFSAGSDRHVCQRNIAVVRAASPAAIDLGLDLGYVATPGTCDVDLEVAAPAAMEWLQLYTGRGAAPIAPSAATLIAGFLPAGLRGARIPDIRSLDARARLALLHRTERFTRGCEPLKLPLHASCDHLSRGQGHVIRVRNRIEGRVVGGYTVVLLSAP